MSDRKQRYAAIQVDILRLLDQAANDNSESGMIGLGATWLAAEMFIRNEEAHIDFVRDEAREDIDFHG